MTILPMTPGVTWGVLILLATLVLFLLYMIHERK